MADAAAIFRPNALLRWLHYDPARVPIVEAAYDEFIVRSRYGIAILVAFVATLVAALIVEALDPGNPPIHHAMAMSLVITLVPASILLLALLPVRRVTIVTMLRGSASLGRSVALGAICGALIALVELFATSAAQDLHLDAVDRSHAVSAALAAAIYVWGFVAIVVLPVLQVLAVQGWLQTRMRGMGAVNSACIGACALVTISWHQPSWLAGLALFLAMASFRASIGSLAGAITACVTNALAFVALVLIRHSVLHY